MTREAAACDLCARDDGNYHFGRVCCCARFITSLPMVALRRGWMARWKERKNPAMYAEIEREVKARWQEKQEESARAGGLLHAG